MEEAVDVFRQEGSIRPLCVQARAPVRVRVCVLCCVSVCVFTWYKYLRFLMYRAHFF